MNARIAFDLLVRSIAAGGVVLCSLPFMPASAQQVQDTGEPEVTVSGLYPGGTGPLQQASATGKKYDKDPQAIAEGRQLFIAFNCVGCHASGGGGMGPPLTAHAWLYGSSIDNIAADVFEGRPNGMPAWRGKIPDNQVWSIAAFVRSLTQSGPMKPL